MTISTYAGLDTALSGLEAMQAGIDTTGENISNASTPGYSEQVVDLGESSPITIADGYESDGGYQMGTGVNVDDITRQRDAFLDVQYRTQNTSASNASTLAAQLGDVQSALGTSTSSGIGSALTTFYSAWTTLSQNPTSSTAQQAVVSAGSQLAQQFNSVSQQMSTVESQAQSQYDTLMGSNGEVSQYANQIAQLNGQIASAQSEGVSANTLEDQRDVAIDNLSALGSVSVQQSSDGTDTITFGGASSALVTGETVTMPTAATMPNPGGQLGALQSLASSSGPIGSLSSSLDSLASSVISQVNSLQSSSSPFFSGNSASTMSVVATASTVQGSSAGSDNSGDLASQIAAGADTATNGYAAFIGQLGSTVQSANNTNTTAQSLLTSLSNQRQSVSGVSLDQEMTNLITYQQGYEASARMMSTMQSVLQTLISSVGGAGL